MTPEEADEIMRQAYDHLERARAEEFDVRRESAERRARIEFEQATSPPPVDFSGKSLADMSAAEYGAWLAAGRPALAQREGRELQKYVEKAAMSLPAPTLDMHALGQEIGDELGRVEAQIKRDVDQQIAELRAELRVAIGTIRAEIAVAGDIEQLKREIEQLRTERRGLKVVSS